MATTIPGAPPEHSSEGETTGRDGPARAGTALAVDPPRRCPRSAFGSRMPSSPRKRGPSVVALLVKLDRATPLGPRLRGDDGCAQIVRLGINVLKFPRLRHDDQPRSGTHAGRHRIPLQPGPERPAEPAVAGARGAHARRPGARLGRPRAVREPTRDPRCASGNRRRGTSRELGMPATRLSPVAGGKCEGRDRAFVWREILAPCLALNSLVLDSRALPFVCGGHRANQSLPWR